MLINQVIPICALAAAAHVLSLGGIRCELR
jgi:hypothetical protein